LIEAVPKVTAVLPVLVIVIGDGAVGMQVHEPRLIAHSCGFLRDQLRRQLEGVVRRREHGVADPSTAMAARLWCLR